MPDVVDADADRIDIAVALQFLQRPVTAALFELLQVRGDACLALVVLEVEVMHHQRVDLVHAHAQQALFVGSQHAVTAVVEAQVERQTHPSTAPG